MSLFRRMLLIAKVSSEIEGSLVLDFSDGVVILNDEGNGNKITVSEGDVTLNE